MNCNVDHHHVPDDCNNLYTVTSDCRTIWITKVDV
jgi:hypothetical protein